MWHPVRARSGVVASVVVALVGAVEASPAAAAEMLRIGTRDGPRTAILLPAERTPAPAVVVLHGAISTAAWAAGRFGFAEAALARGFSAVFPQSLGAQWNAERGPLA